MAAGTSVVDKYCGFAATMCMAKSFPMCWYSSSDKCFVVVAVGAWGTNKTMAAAVPALTSRPDVVVSTLLWT